MHSFRTVLHTPRLLLRPFTLGDVESNYRINQDPEVTRYTHDGGVKTLDQMREIIDTKVLGDYQRHGYGRFAVEWKKTNEFIGFCGLKYLPKHNEVDIGYRFSRKFWGMGIATESAKPCMKFGFTTLGLHRIVGFVIPENIASIRVLCKLGMKYETDIMEDGVIAKRYAKHLS